MCSCVGGGLLPGFDDPAMFQRKGLYVVRVGLRPGIYTTWSEASAHVHDVSRAVHARVRSYRDAVGFIARGGGPVELTPNGVSTGQEFERLGEPVLSEVRPSHLVLRPLGERGPLHTLA